MSLLLATTAGTPAVAQDSVTFSDSAVSVTERLVVATDAVTFSDSAVSTTERLSEATDSVTFSDSAVSTTERVATADDTVTFSDSADAALAFSAAADDTVTFSDSAVSTTERVATADDTVVFSDSAVAVVMTSVVADAVDTIAFSDSAVASKVPAAGGAASALRRWLQQIYTEDFKRYERERRERVEPKPLDYPRIVEVKARAVPQESTPPRVELPVAQRRVGAFTPVHVGLIETSMQVPEIADISQEVEAIRRKAKTRPSVIDGFELAEDELRMLMALL